MKILLSLLIAPILAVGLCSLAFAQTDQAFDEYGVGPRDAAMGNAYTGVADDFAAAYYNPAGTSQTYGVNFTFGYKFLSPNLYAKFAGFAKNKFTRYPGTGWGLFGFTTDFNLHEYIDRKYTDPFSFGVAIALSNFVHSYTNYSEEYTPYFFRYQDRPVALLSVYANLAIKFTEWFSVGGGFVLAPSLTYADARVRTDITLPSGNADTKQGIVNRSYSIEKPLAGMLFRVPIGGMPWGYFCAISAPPASRICSAVAPSITQRGSTTLPIDFDIFRPCSSRTIP